MRFISIFTHEPNDRPLENSVYGFEEARVANSEKTNRVHSGYRSVFPIAGYLSWPSLTAFYVWHRNQGVELI